MLRGSLYISACQQAPVKFQQSYDKSIGSLLPLLVIALTSYMQVYIQREIS